LTKYTKHITVFEHESLRLDRGNKRLLPSQLEALQSFYGQEGIPYYSLIHHGVKFNEHVGVIQVGNTIIEILPKADRNSDANRWRNVLISMLRAVGVFDIHAPSNSDLQLRTNSILDLYFELFIRELEYLFRRGLVKKYRRIEGNSPALKGSIHFAKHINLNLVHQERFYVNHYTYDKQHDIHAILYKALKLLKNINTNTLLDSRIGALLLDFPDLYDIKITESLFSRISLDRKTEPYNSALEIARLILLNYHPDVRKGNNNVLALMFDMNKLWEKFVYVSLRKFKSKDVTITAQHAKNFWKPTVGANSKIKPDIILNRNTGECMVLDTKWKNLNGYNPSPEDLRQMFVYMKYYKAKRVALIYPGEESRNRSGKYYDHYALDANTLSNNICGVISIEVETDIKKWQKSIFETVIKEKDI
jgi:5-methylcytosine-specific restriction enzyme subunit McrC